MAFFQIPVDPNFNTALVTKTVQTQPVIAEHLNDYIQTLLENDQYLKNDADSIKDDIVAKWNLISVEISKKLDGEGTVTDYNEAISMTETGKVPDCTIIRQMYLNFLAGCRAIATAITGGRDGNGTGGISTPVTTDPTTMAGNITAMALQNYNEGLNAATGVTPDVKLRWSGNTQTPAAGASVSLQAKVISEGYLTAGTIADEITAGVNGTAIATTAGTGEETINIVPGVYKQIKVNRTGAYDAGAKSVRDVSATFSGSFSGNNYIVKATRAGYIANNGQALSTEAGINATAIATTAGTGEETIAITPGIYKQIKVNRTNAYNAGAKSVRDVAPKFSASFSSQIAGNASNYVVKTQAAGAGYLGNNTNAWSVAAGMNGTAINTTASNGQAVEIAIVPGIYNKIKVNQKPAYDKGVSDADGRVNTDSKSYEQAIKDLTLGVANAKHLYFGADGGNNQAHGGSSSIEFPCPVYATTLHVSGTNGTVQVYNSANATWTQITTWMNYNSGSTFTVTSHRGKTMRFNAGGSGYASISGDIYWYFT